MLSQTLLQVEMAAGGEAESDAAVSGFLQNYLHLTEVNWWSMRILAKTL